MRGSTVAPFVIAPLISEPNMGASVAAALVPLLLLGAVLLALLFVYVAWTSDKVCDQTRIQA